MPDQDGQEFDQLPDDHPVVKSLRAAREELRKEREQRHLYEVQAKYPDLGLTAEDFEGLTPDKFEQRAQRFASLRTPEATEQSQQQEAPKPELSPAEEAFRRMAQSPLESRPAMGTEKKIGLGEAFSLMRRDPAAFEKVKAAGGIEGWPDAKDTGGSIILNPGV